MLSKWKNILLSFMLIAILAIPASMVGANDEDSSVQETIEVVETDESTTTENIKMEKMEKSEIFSSIEGMDIRNEMRQIQGSDLDFTPPDDIQIGGLKDQIVVPNAVPFDPELYTPSTRASDIEDDNNDQVNGSALSNWGEKVSGTMEHSNVPTLVDDLDWYEIDLHDDAMTNGGASQGLYNITLELTEFSSADGDLYEFETNEDGSDYANDYFDYMYLLVQYYDPFFAGFTQIGGIQFDYDDGDDTDGVVKEEGNWTHTFHTPIRAYGTNDANGFGDDFTEYGFIYIGFRFGFGESQTAPTTRSEYTIDYEFVVDSVKVDMDPIANDHLNGTAPSSSSNVLNPRVNSEDWYKIEGNDYTQLWNMTYDMTILAENSRAWDLSGGSGQVLLFNDIWVTLVSLCPNPGDDGEFNTADDMWWGHIQTVSSVVNFGRSVNANGGTPYTFTNAIHNNWTDAPMDSRYMYVGLIIEPIEIIYVQGQGWAGPYAPLGHITQMEYDIVPNVIEHAPNNAPEISNIELESDYDFVPSGDGGNYETLFTIMVTYLDEDNDPPEVINLILDKGTYAEGIVDISVTPKDPFDFDYTSESSDNNPAGRVYQLKILGEDLTDTPEVHTIHANCTDYVNKDEPDFEIRGAKDSLMGEYEDGLKVWEDDPVDINPTRQPFEELDEDDPTTYFPLEGLEGQFKDPENDFVIFYIWNETTEEWSDNFDSEIMNIDVIEYEGMWQLAVTPKFNQYGTETVTLQAEDEHSWANLTTSITIREVNDPPMVEYIDVEGTRFEVDNVDPLRPVIHLEGEYVFKEDTEYTFNIIAKDTDLEEDWTDLEFGYVRSASSDWDEDPDVGYNTGEVTFTPNNNDVRVGNDKMVFSIDDHRDDGDIKLEVYLEVENVNDPPTIQIPTTTARTWEQFSKISIRPIASDEDKGDQITFSVNFLDAIGDEYDSIEDQLPNMNVDRGIDWELTPTTGDFWFEIDDQNIWKTSSGMVNQQEITIVFMATDSADPPGTATAFIKLVLNDENEEPPRPASINVNPIKPNAKEPVNFWVEPVLDPDGDRLTYKWDFGDGSTGEGINVNHTYATKGYKTVQMWVEDGQFSTEKINTRVEVAEEPTTDDDDTTPDDDDDTTPVESSGDDTMIIIVAVIIIVIVVLVVVLFIFLLLRKKPAPTAQMYPGYDQQALGAYGQQGLPPGAVGELPPQATPELPPAGEGQYPPDNLPPVEGQPGMEQPPLESQPEFAQPAPDTAPPVAAAPEMATPEPAPDQPAGNACPSCGAAVDPTWFLCPNCKSPLQ